MVEPKFPVTLFGTDWATTADTVEYRKTLIDNMVRMDGAVNSTSASPIGDVLTLPSGYRPLVNHKYFSLAVLDAADFTYKTKVFKLSTAGVLSFANAADVPAVTSYIIWLNGVSFTLD